MTSVVNHINKIEESGDFLYEINNNRSNRTNSCNNIINYINENTTLYTTNKKNYEQKILAEQEMNLSKGKSTIKIKRIKFRFRPIKRGLYFSIQKKSKKGRNRTKILYSRLSRHNMESCDNMLRKIKSWVISDITKFINKKLEKVNENSKKNKLKLYTILKDQSYNTNIEYNRQLLEKKMDDILSDNVSKKTKIAHCNYNKITINQIKEKKYDNIIKILNLTFLQCINHYIDKERIDCLEGFEGEFKLKKKRISPYEDIFLKFVYNIQRYFSDKSFRTKMNNQKIEKSK